MHCAVEGPVVGGPDDVSGPKIISISKPSGSKIGKNETIKLEFDEHINPASAYRSIESNNEIIYRVSSSKVLISPSKYWEEPVIININRDLTDYQDNKIPKSLNIIYSTEGTVPDNYINGTLHEIDTTKIYKVYLYRFPIERNIKEGSTNKKLKYYRKVDSDIHGNFSFKNIHDDKYIIVASSSNISRPSAVYSNEYSLSNSDYVVSIPMQDENIKNIKVNLLVSKPATRLKTKNIKMINSHFLEVFYDNNISDFFQLDHTNNSLGDSIFIDIEKSNIIEKYYISDYFVINKFAADSISPSIDSYKINDNIIQINFSEPILLSKPDSSIAIYYNDSYSYIKAEVNNFNQIEAKYSLIENEEIYVQGSSIKDYNNNIFSLEMKKIGSSNKRNLSGGSVLGEIEYKGDKDLIVKLISTLGNNYSMITSNNGFSFHHIPEGQYKIVVFEKIIDFSDEYFPGTIFPYNRAANFLIYDELIEVRNHWIIKDIRLAFEE